MFPSPKPNSTLSLLFLHSLFQWLAPHAPQQTVGIILRAFNWEWGLPPIPDFLLFFTNSCQFFLPHISGTWYLHSIFSSLTISSHHASWFIAIVSELAPQWNPFSTRVFLTYDLWFLTLQWAPEPRGGLVKTHCRGHSRVSDSGGPAVAQDLDFYVPRRWWRGWSGTSFWKPLLYTLVFLKY